MDEISQEQLKSEYFESIIRNIQGLMDVLPDIKRDWQDDKGIEVSNAIEQMEDDLKDFFMETYKLFFYLQEIEKVGKKLTSWHGELNSLGGFASINQIADLVNKKIGRITDMNSMP